VRAPKTNNIGLVTNISRVVGHVFYQEYICVLSREQREVLECAVTTFLGLLEICIWQWRLLSARTHRAKP